jgi:hypothetical protein
LAAKGFLDPVDQTPNLCIVALHVIDLVARLAEEEFKCFKLAV